MNRLGSTLLRYDSLPSTNDLAREMAIAGAGEGTSILAREQTKGRGRQGRLWSSPAGEGLYFSVVIRPDIKPAESPVITLAAAVAVAETLSVDFNVEADIKWPNDVQARGRKICGILVEAAIEGEMLQYAVIGIGVNIAQREFSSELKESATSFFLETGKTITPEEFLKPLLDRLDHWYQTAVLHPEEIIVRWEKLSTYAVGCRVRIETADDAFDGVTEGLARNGALKVRLENGAVREVLSGEVRLRQRNPA